ncbi:hypothetical protein N7456_007468 [Penicillium angulare]|uniref:F-box domain-containing protein n=1 Tax=Penicillium angulare TaxID=116970 RepID=A0A9W9FAQ5_9EURO|nr:hypothetical protein N7456_007468 [Penicillium angulare]
MSARSFPTDDVLSRLPVELIEMILIELDLASIHNLNRSSRTVASVLREERTARRIIEKAIRSTYPKEIQILIRKFALLRWTFLEWDTRAVNDTDAFIARFIRTDDGYLYLPHGVPLLALIDTLAAAATIRYLSFDVLNKMIDRCKALELFRISNPGEAYTLPPWFNHPFPPTGTNFPRPFGIPYQQLYTGPISATEEMRATRVLWQIFLIWELRVGVSGTRWSPQEKDRLNGLSSEEIWILPRGANMEQIKAMTAELYPCLPTDAERYRAVKRLAYDAQWICRGDLPLFRTVL